MFSINIVLEFKNILLPMYLLFACHILVKIIFI